MSSQKQIFQLSDLNRFPPEIQHLILREVLDRAARNRFLYVVCADPPNDVKDLLKSLTCPDLRENFYYALCRGGDLELACRPLAALKFLRNHQAAIKYMRSIKLMVFDRVYLCKCDPKMDEYKNRVFHIKNLVNFVYDGCNRSKLFIVVGELPFELSSPSDRDLLTRLIDLRLGSPCLCRQTDRDAWWTAYISNAKGKARDSLCPSREVKRYFLEDFVVPQTEP